MTLTPKQSAAAACLLDGLRGRQAALALGIKRKTMDRRIEELRYKFGAFTNEELRQILKGMQ